MILRRLKQDALGLWMVLIGGCLIVHIATWSALAQSKNGGGVETDGIVRSYRIAGLRVEGLRHADKELLLMIAGLKEGQRFTWMGDEGAKAVRNLWKQGLFGDVQIKADSIVDQNIYLCIYLEEKPRLSKVVFNRKVSKASAEEITESLKGFKGKILSEEVQRNIDRVVRKYYMDKGFRQVGTRMGIVPDSNQINTSILNVTVIPGPKVRVGELVITGNQLLSEAKIARTLKTARPKVWWNPFRTGKWDPEKFEEQKDKLIKRYQQLGYRDARVVRDSVYTINPQRMGLALQIYDG
jgi:outer membrane protein insertion porin family